MSEQQDGGPAFPVAENHKVAADIGWTCGMSLRDYFAAAALQGLLAFPGKWEGDATKYPNIGADLAYRYADAMLSERRKA